MKKFFKIFGITLLSIILVICASLMIFWNNEMATIFSISKLSNSNVEHQDGCVYKINYHGDYYLDDLIARGGVKSDNELISFLINHITKGAYPLEVKVGEMGCSSFTLTNSSNERLFCRNYDMINTNSAIVFTNPKDSNRHASVSSVDLQYVAIDASKGISSIKDYILSLASVYTPVDGMNDMGVAISVHISYQGMGESENKQIPTEQNSDKPDITTTSLARLILDYADDLDEAIEIASSYDMHDSANHSFQFMVADSSGASAILSWANEDSSHENEGENRKLVVTYNTDNYQIMTNFLPIEGYYDEDDELHGLDRYETLSSLLSECNGVSDEPFYFLEKVSRRKMNQNAITVYSVAYNLTKKTVTIIDNEHYNDEAHTFTYSLN